MRPAKNTSMVLALSANTSFAGFPRLCRIIAEDDFLPHALANVGRRLVYSGGIITLSVLAGLLLIIFGGITDRLIPLFAVGAFGAFTLSQAGMVMHWKRTDPRGHWHALVINIVGAVATSVALAVIIIAKFVEGAWIILLLIPAIYVLFHFIKRHYEFVARQNRLQPLLAFEERLLAQVHCVLKHEIEDTIQELRFMAQRVLQQLEM